MMKRLTFQRTTCLAALVLFAAFSHVLARKGDGGKPGGGGGSGGGGGGSSAPVAYQLTWFPATNGYTEIQDINSAGFAVGRYHDETGALRPFWTTAEGVINPLDNWWTLPAGFRVEAGELQINDSNQVCGILVNDSTGQHELFLADLLTDSLEPVGSVPGNAQWLHLNENGDVALLAGGTSWYTLLYVRFLNTIYSFEQDYPGLMPTGINDNLQVSLISQEDPEGTGLIYHGSARLTFTFDPSDGSISVPVEDLGTATSTENPVALSWGGINNAGTVFGCFETSVTTRGRRRESDMMAGCMVSGASSWTELDAGLPTGSTLWGDNQIQAAACVLGANEAGQVVGGYDSIGHRSADLFLLDPLDGILNLNDIVTGTSADVGAFLSSNDFRGVHTTEPDPVTGYGIISGYDVVTDGAFILTPVPVAP